MPPCSAILLVVVLAACSIKNGRAETIEDVASEYATPIASLTSEITKLITNTGRKLGMLKTTMIVTTDDAAEQISVLLSQLGDVVEEARMEADQLPKDITGCIRAEELGLREVEVWWLIDCAKSFDVNEVFFHLDRLGNMRDGLSGSPETCKEKSGEDAGLYRDCLEERLEVTRMQFARVDDDVGNEIQLAEIVAANCVKATFKNLDMKITEIAHTFKSCVRSIT